MAHRQDRPIARTYGPLSGPHALADEALLLWIIRGVATGAARIGGIHDSLDGDDHFAELVARFQARVRFPATM